METKEAPKTMAAPAKIGGAITADADAAKPTLRGAPPATKSAADLIELQEPALRACLGAGDHVEIHVKVDAAGKPVTTVDGASSAKVKACLEGVIGKVKLPSEKASVNVTIDKSNR
jgi:hypothetical protein